MTKDEIDELLNGVDKNITKLTKKAYEQLIAMVRDGISPQEARKQIQEALSTINEESAAIIAASLSNVLSTTVTAEYVKNFEVHGVKLSKRLYVNSRDVALQTTKVINDAVKQNKTIAEISKLLYEGYDFKLDPLHVKEKKTIPKWLKEELNKPPSQRSFKQVSTIKTKALKASYTQALKSKSFQEQQKLLKKAFYEKSRYYANRIAQNEVMKSYSIERAKMLADDDEVEVVKLRMSQTHERVDICDYHASVDKFGLGKGVYPKSRAPIPPFHPFCRCRLQEIISRSAKDAHYDAKADKKAMEKFNSYERRLIVGSQRRLDMFYKSGDVLKSSYMGFPMYIDDINNVRYIGGKIKSNTQKMQDFIPVKTIKDAENRLKSIGIEDVSLKGLKKDGLNAVVRAFEEEHKISPIKLYKISTYRKKTDAARAGYSGSLKQIRINLAHIGDIKVEDIVSYEERIKVIEQDIKEWTEKYLGNEKYNQRDIRRFLNRSKAEIHKTRDKILSGQKAKKWSVSSRFEKTEDNLYATIKHEIGHHRHDVFFNYEDVYHVDKIKAVSEYSITNYKEYFAEHYSEYRVNGAENVPERMLKLFKEIDNDK